MAVTIEDVRKAIEAGMEDTDRADLILAALREHDGKLLTRPLMGKVMEATGEKRAYIRRQFGMCAIEFGGYALSGDPDPGICLFLGYVEKNVRIDADNIFERNTAYFSAARERNERRRAALADGKILSKMANAIECMNAGAATFNSLIQYGKPLCESRYDLEKLIDPDLPKVDRR